MSTEIHPAVTASSPSNAAPTAGAAAPAPPRSSPVSWLFRIVLPAVLAAGAAYGGTRGASALTPSPSSPSNGHGEASAKADGRPPGPTVAFEPFLVTVFDANKKSHPMKVSIAVEFDAHTKEELKSFTPRIRDGVLAHLRTLTHEQVTDPGQAEKLRTELLERCKAAGAVTAERVLVTDFVVQ